jgi:DNA-binding CsgD family transcriptional regulator
MKLLETDVRAIVRLLGEVATLQGGHAAQKRYLMDGLCNLIGADCWVWGLACQMDPSQPQVYAGIIQGGFSEERFARYLRALEHPDLTWLGKRFFQEIKEKKCHLTRLRQQIDVDSRFTTSSAYPVWREADVGPLMMSLRPLDERSGSAIAIYRRFHGELFTARESRIVHIVLGEVAWLHELGWPEDRGVSVPTLTVQCRIVLNLLLEGQSRKAIAAHLASFLHTVNDYIKELYHHFQVHSQPELMRRFFVGDGGDEQEVEGGVLISDSRLRRSQAATVKNEDRSLR